MPRKRSAETELRLVKRELAETARLAASNRSDTLRLRYELQKVINERNEWKARFDKLLDRLEPQKQLAMVDGVPENTEEEPCQKKSQQ